MPSSQRLLGPHSIGPKPTVPPRHFSFPLHFAQVVPPSPNRQMAQLLSQVHALPWTEWEHFLAELAKLDRIRSSP